MFCEFHARSSFSFLRGSSQPEELVHRAAELGYGAIAIADHGGFYGSARAHENWGQAANFDKNSILPSFPPCRAAYEFSFPERFAARFLAGISELF